MDFVQLEGFQELFFCDITSTDQEIYIEILIFVNLLHIWNHQSTNILIFFNFMVTHPKRKFGLISSGKFGLLTGAYCF